VRFWTHFDRDAIANSDFDAETSTSHWWVDYVGTNDQVVVDPLTLSQFSALVLRGRSTLQG